MMGLTDEELVVACANVGVDLTCGACAGVFYTGAGLGPHTCGPKTEAAQQDADRAIVRRMHEYATRYGSTSDLVECFIATMAMLGNQVRVRVTKA